MSAPQQTTRCGGSGWVSAGDWKRDGGTKCPGCVECLPDVEMDDHQKVLEFFYCIGTGVAPRNASMVGVLCQLTGWDAARVTTAIQRLHDEKLIAHPTVLEATRRSRGTT